MYLSEVCMGVICNRYDTPSKFTGRTAKLRIKQCVCTSSCFQTQLTAKAVKSHGLYSTCESVEVEGEKGRLWKGEAVGRVLEA